ncbi:hypothetical protein LA6_001234 [Marinibacterium anthonyi]|nr:hypothetical protein LA6_001234 [Marinibacterium anthonyi]
MSRAFRSFMERHIRWAAVQERLKTFEGEGNLLPDRPVEATVEPALSRGMRIMAGAGVNPDRFRPTD